MSVPVASDVLLAPLDEEQRAVAEAVSGPVCVVAGAGTGKTRAITHRIAHAVGSGATAAENVLAVTFTARAAGEMRERLRSLGAGRVVARTFHAAALRQLQHFWPRAIGGSAPPLMEHKAPLVGEAAARLGLRVDRASIRDLSAEVEWSKVGLLTPETYAAAALAAGRTEAAGQEPTVVARVLDAYEDAKTSRGVIDFEDVLLLLTAMLDEREDIAAEVRSQYRWFTVDEYQDVSAAQQRLLEAWVGGRRDVCVVGDPNQTIYTFAGADPALLTRFAAAHPGCTVVHLVRNYRSRPSVVELGNGVLAAAPRRDGVALRAVRGPTGVAPTFTEHDDDVAEAQAVAARIAALVREGHDVASTAVLVRTNGQLEALEEALGDAGVPYLVRGGDRFFSRREVREAVVLLRGAAKAGVTGGEHLPDQVSDVLSSTGWTPEPPSARGQVRDRWESLAALVQHARRLVETVPDASLAHLVADLETRAAQQHAPRLEGVTLSTLHAAKGLEWDVVFLPGLSEGLMPIALASTPEAVEEERRLLYVGITRAREQVHVSWARARTPGGRAGRRASRFLDTVRPGAAEAASRIARRGAEPGSRRRSTPRRPALCLSCQGPLSTAAQRTSGRCADCPPRYDPALFDALREWRSAVASEARIPPYVVFTDATLEAIADRTPTDEKELATIAGVGSVKLDKYGAEVLALLRGQAPGTA